MFSPKVGPQSQSGSAYPRGVRVQTNEVSTGNTWLAFARSFRGAEEYNRGTRGLRERLTGQMELLCWLNTAEYRKQQNTAEKLTRVRSTDGSTPLAFARFLLFNAHTCTLAQGKYMSPPSKLMFSTKRHSVFLQLLKYFAPNNPTLSLLRHILTDEQK